MPDDELGTALRSLLGAADPVPPAAREAASRALSWRDLDAELATLTEGTLAGATVRGGPSHLLTFTASRVTVDVEVSVEADAVHEAGTVHLAGQVSPPGPATVAVEFPDGSRDTRADDRGRFTVSDIRPGLLRVSVRPGTGPDRVVTPWFRA